MQVTTTQFPEPFTSREPSGLGDFRSFPRESESLLNLETFVLTFPLTGNNDNIDPTTLTYILQSTPAKMGVGSAKRAAAKAQDKGSDSGRASTPVRAHRAASRAPKSGDSPFTTPKSSAKKASGFTSKLPTDQQRRSNGRQTGRNLIMWSRTSLTSSVLSTKLTSLDSRPPYG